MLDYLAKKLGQPAHYDAAVILDAAFETGFALNRFHPRNLALVWALRRVTLTLSSLMDGKLKEEKA